MNLGATVVAVARVFRRRPADLLPFYVLGAAVPAIARVVAFLGFGLAYLYLAVTGRVDAVLAEIEAVDPAPPDPEAEPDAFEEWAQELVAAVEPALTPGVLSGVALTVLATILVVALLYAAVGAGQLAACFARLRDERGLLAGVTGVRRYWLSFLGLFVLEFFLWVGATAVLIAVVVGAAAVGGPVLGVLVGLLAVFGWLLFVLAVRAIFVFAPVGVVVDGVGVGRSLANAVGFVRRRPVEAVFYYAVAVAVVFGFGALVSALAVVGAGSVVSLVSLFVVVPALDLLKTALYGDYRDSISPPEPVERPLGSQFAAGVRRGWRELGDFVRSTPGSHAVSVLAILVGFAMGWVAAGPFVDVFPTSIAARLEGHVPPRAALEFFGNNWGVALTTAYGGIALAIPAIASLWFNGLFFGVYARLEVAPVELLAFVVPHGLLEIPAIVVAGAAGVYLGLAWWRTWRGPADRAALADALERTFWVLVGVGVLLAVAAVVEGFVSPYYYRPFL